MIGGPTTAAERKDVSMTKVSSVPLRISFVTSIALSAVIATAAVMTYRAIAEPQVVVVKAPPAPEPPPPPECPSPVQDGHDGQGAIQIGTLPFAKLQVDGKHVGTTPFYGPRTMRLPLGEHRLDFTTDEGKTYRFDLVIHEDDPANKLIIQLGKHVAPRQLGHISAFEVDREPALSDARAAKMFEAAVNALRDRETAKGCRMLDEIIEQAAVDSVWAAKAGKLSLRRCDVVTR
jgi:hypothetical protein